MTSTFDIECLKNYTLFAFMSDAGKVSKVDMRGKKTCLSKRERMKLRRLLENGTIVTFNGIKYDYIITAFALAGHTCRELYELSQKIIKGRAQPWQLYRGSVKELDWSDHIDIMEPAPDVMVSLKLYGARLFSKRLWEYDVDWDKKLPKKDMDGLNKYCVNDLILTWDLYNKIKPSIELRERMSKQYGLDLRSKSDAQVAEAVIISEIGGNISKPSTPKAISYTPPSFIKFKSKEMKGVVTQFKNCEFDVNQANGKPVNPQWLKDTVIRLGEAQFQMGLGGLHSMEQSITVVSDKDNVMRNSDVASFYPRIIINEKLYPPQLGKAFLKVYNHIVETRLKAKAKGDKATAESLKITINGSFGKFGSKYSKLYAPELLLATTITGQLALLMLIEKLELLGIPVISANTDGVEYYCPRDKVKLALKTIAKWEKITGYTMDNGDYISLHARDVNNYVAKYDGYVKSKGAYKDLNDVPILKKNPQMPICYTAVREYINSGIPIEKTIRKCKDIAQFCSATKVTGGAMYNGEKVGGVVRWYYSTESDIPMLKIKPNPQGTHAKVPLTDGCKPMMDLSEKMPKDLDYDTYIGYAIKHYNLLGGDDYVIQSKANSSR